MKSAIFGLLALLPLVALSGCSGPSAVGEAAGSAQSAPAEIPRTSPTVSPAGSAEATEDRGTAHPPIDGSNQALVDAVADRIQGLPESRSSIGGLAVTVKTKVVTVWWVGSTPKSLNDIVARRPYGVDVEVQRAMHPRRLLETIAGKIVQDGIDGRGPSVYSAGARFDGSGISVSVAADDDSPNAEVIETTLKQITARYGSGLGIRVDVGPGITQTSARTP